MRVNSLVHLIAVSHFFSDYCLIQDLSTKRIIGRGHESGVLYILDPEVARFIACSEVVTPFELHCRLGHPSLSLLKKLYPIFSSLSSLNYKLCKYSKSYHVHLSLGVNKQASAPFELVHSNASSSNPVQSEDLPTALCKGKCRCVHPISSFVSYNHLSSSSCSSIASPYSISLPNTICETLFHPGWRSAMVDCRLYMTIIRETWYIYLLERRLLIVVGCL